MERKKTRRIYLGNLPIGDGADISIQSMTKTDTRDVEATVRQIEELTKAGCQVVRLAVVDDQAAEALGDIKKRTTIPLVADIHFDHKLALTALKQGIDGLRINPGNIGSEIKVKEVIKSAMDREVPIRIGVNSGSVHKELLEKYGGPTKEALVESALSHVAILERNNYDKIKISIKSSSVPVTIEANKLLSSKCNYPLHLGVTEAGFGENAVIKSAVGIGALLAEGIGDTLRVSLTDDPVKEVEVAKNLLRTLELGKKGVELISCPTCGRTEIHLMELVRKIEALLAGIDKELTIAVMGCPVNGPGEAREADLGIAGGKGLGLIFKKGNIIAKVPEDKLLEEFKKELDKILRE